jgi:hypothetical protein
MTDPNPYESPERPLRRSPETRYEKPREKWLGILGILGGIALLLFTAYFVLAHGVLLCWTLGGGIGVLGVGAFLLKSYFDDKRYSVIVNELNEESF